MHLIPGRKRAYSDLGHVLVLGLGVSGKAVSAYLAELLGDRVRSLTIIGGVFNNAAAEWADKLAADINTGSLHIFFDEEDAANVLPEGAEKFDLCIISPGISVFSVMSESAQKASQEVISEIEFAWRESPSDSKWIAITGTNGKTTTTSLLDHILKNSGFESSAVGNIGDACITKVSDDLKEIAAGNDVHPIYVSETSSYQLASIVDFAPNIAIILGITPDHIKWHKTHEHYANSKFKVLDNLRRVDESVAILDALNDEVRSKIREIKAESDRGYDYIPLGTQNGIYCDMRKACGSDNSAFIDDANNLVIAYQGKEHSLCNTHDLKIVGPHNWLNALAASSAAIAIGANDRDIERSLESFPALEHRIEPVDVVSNVEYFNDSKATNVDAALVAVSTFLPKKPIIMFGGEDKGTDLVDLVKRCETDAKACICYGEAGQRFYDALSPLQESGIIISLVKSFDDAFEAASSMALAGDVVLLSPACASFDEFSCFEERGEHFKELVDRLKR